MLSAVRIPREQAQTGQVDGHNATLAYFEETYGATSINWFWKVGARACSLIEITLAMRVVSMPANALRKCWTNN